MVHLTESLYYLRPRWGKNLRWKNGRRPFDPAKIEANPHERTPLRCRNSVIPRKGQKEGMYSLYFLILMRVYLIVLFFSLSQFYSFSFSFSIDVVCIKEMLNLFACMKLNDLNEKECPKELDAFQKCYGKFVVSSCDFYSILFLFPKIHFTHLTIGIFFLIISGGFPSKTTYQRSHGTNTRTNQINFSSS